MARAAAVDGSKLAAAITAANVWASIPANPPSAAKLPNKFILFMFPMLPRLPNPGIPANGIIDSGFFGSNAPNPGMLDNKLAFKPARFWNCMLAAAADEVDLFFEDVGVLDGLA